MEIPLSAVVVAQPAAETEQTAHRVVVRAERLLPLSERRRVLTVIMAGWVQQIPPPMRLVVVVAELEPWAARALL
jgi:hypothetical protein